MDKIRFSAPSAFVGKNHLNTTGFSYMQCSNAVMKLNVKSSCSIPVILSDGGGWSQPNFLIWRKKTKQLFPPFQQRFYCTEPFSQYIIDKSKRAQQPLIPDTNIWFKDIPRHTFLVICQKQNSQLLPWSFFAVWFFYLIKTILLFFAFICATHISFYLNFIIYFFLSNPM